MNYVIILGSYKIIVGIWLSNILKQNPNHCDKVLNLNHNSNILLKIFNSRHPILYIVLFIYTFLVHGILYFKDFDIPKIENSFFFSIINYEFYTIPEPFIITISIIGVFLMAIFINQILNKYSLVKNPSFVPTFVFISISGIFTEMIIISPAVLGIFLILFIIYNLLSIFDMEYAVQNLFFVSFFIGMATLVYSPLVIYIILVYISIPILKRPTWWELAIVPFGFIFPLYLTGLGFYLFGKLDFMLETFINNFPVWGINLPKQYLPYIIPIIYLAVFSILGFIKYSVNDSAKLVRENRYQRTLSVLFVITLIIFLLSTSSRLYIGFILLIPVAMLLGRLYSEHQSRFFEISFLILLLIDVYVQIVTF